MIYPDSFTPLCAMAQKFPKNPIPEASATPEPPPSSLAPFYEDDHPAPGMKWVSLQGEYEMLVPEGWQEESVEDDELGLYYAVFDEEAGCGIALMCLKEMSGIIPWQSPIPTLRGSISIFLTMPIAAIS